MSGRFKSSIIHASVTTRAWHELYGCHWSHGLSRAFVLFQFMKQASGDSVIYVGDNSACDDMAYMTDTLIKDGSMVGHYRWLMNQNYPLVMVAMIVAN